MIEHLPCFKCHSRHPPKQANIFPLVAVCSVEIGKSGRVGERFLLRRKQKQDPDVSGGV